MPSSKLASKNAFYFDIMHISSIYFPPDTRVEVIKGFRLQGGEDK